jgi:putative ABC transport system permease protein
MRDPTLALLNVDKGAADSAHMAELRKDLTMEGLQSLSSVELKRTLATVLGRVINGLSVIGIGAMCLASLGVANMVIASVHARRYEFGVLRAIGAGRWQLVRLVLAEVTLVAVVAGLLGTGAGLWFAFMAARVDLAVIGVPTRFIDPDTWRAAAMAGVLLCEALGLTILLAWLASLAPAVRGAMTAQRALLAAGRG